MAQTSNALNHSLSLSPKELLKALTVSAKRARCLASAFGLKIPATRDPAYLQMKKK